MRDKTVIDAMTPLESVYMLSIDDRISGEIMGNVSTLHSACSAMLLLRAHPHTITPSHHHSSHRFIASTPIF